MVAEVRNGEGKGEYMLHDIDHWCVPVYVLMLWSPGVIVWHSAEVAVSEDR